MNSDKWNEICFLLYENLKAEISENAFEQNVIQALSVLGWKEYLNDFSVRPSFQIGASNRITPDFVIKSQDDTRLFVIEIKQPNIQLTSNFQQQLFSYMRQLKLEYGILIGEYIQIFYDGNLSGQHEPILLETIRFNRNDKKGENFVRLFTKDTFAESPLEEFVHKAIKKINKNEVFSKLKRHILSDTFSAELTNIIKQHFIKQYDGEIVDNVIKELHFEITTHNEKRICLTNSGIDTRNKPQTTISKNIIHKNTNKITENGMKIGQFVQYNVRKLFEEGLITEEEIVRLQSKEYSSITFEQSKEFLRSSEKAITGDDRRNRYYAKEMFCGNYHLNSQWLEKHWGPFKAWVEKLKTT